MTLDGVTRGSFYVMQLLATIYNNVLVEFCQYLLNINEHHND